MMKLRCKKEYFSPVFRMGEKVPRFIPGQFYDVLEQRSNPYHEELWLFRISGTTKRDCDVESLKLSEVYDYFETLEETRDNTLTKILK